MTARIKVTPWVSRRLGVLGFQWKCTEPTGSHPGGGMTGNYRYGQTMAEAIDAGRHHLRIVHGYGAHAPTADEMSTLQSGENRWDGKELCDNKDAPAGVGSTLRGLTRSSDLAERG